MPALRKFLCFFLTITFVVLPVVSQETVEEEGIYIPKQKPATTEVTEDGLPLPELNVNTNLVALLDEIRNAVKKGNLEYAQKLASRAVAEINITEENSFYLKQIRKEETKIYYEQAQAAFKKENYSLASHLLGRYRDNVALELSERKLLREAKIADAGNKDATLVGRLVEELDKAKKDLEQIRAKSGLPDDDAIPDLQRLMEEETLKVTRATKDAERLLLKARQDSAQGQYDTALEYIEEALSTLPSNTSTIALVTDLYKARQQIVWYKMGEAMLKGKIADVQQLVIDYKEIEESRRAAETETLGVGDEIDFDAEIKKAQEKNKEQAELASEMIEDAKDLIDQKDYIEADGMLYKIKNYLEPSTLTWPVILEAALLKNRIHLAKSEDAREIKDWDAAQKHLDAFKQGFYQDRDIQGDTLSFGRPGLRETKGEKGEKKELQLADEMAKRIRDDQKDPYRRDITEFSPDWKEQELMLEDLLMRAKVQFINGDLTGATESYRTVEARFSDNLEAKVMLKRISQMRQEESYLGYLKTRQEMLEEIEREWERPKVFDRQVEEVKQAQNESTELENKMDLIKIPEVFFNEAPLDEVAQELMLQAKQFDLTEQDPTKKGVQIVVIKPEGEDLPLLNIKLNTMELGKMVSFIAEMVGWTFDIRPDAVVFTKSGGTFKGRDLETEFYKIGPQTLRRLTGGAFDDGGGGGGMQDPFAPAPDDGGGGDNDAMTRAIIDFFSAAGITFNEGNGELLKFNGFDELIVRHNRRTHDAINRIIARMDEERIPQIEIEAKFLEVQEGALDEISFDWQYNFGNAVPEVDPTTGMPLVDSRGRPKAVFEKNIIGNTRTLANAHSPSGIPRDVTISYPDNPDAGQVIANPTPRLPGNVGIGEGVSPLIDIQKNFNFGGNSILPSFQASILINALKRKQGTDLLCAPRVTVMDKEEATITVAQEFIYPTNYTAAQAGGGGLGGGGGAGGGLGGGVGGGITIQPAIPEFNTDSAPDGEEMGFREVGVVMNVQPNYDPKYKTIEMTLTPKVTEFDGFVEYGGVTGSIGTGFSTATVLTPSGILMPIFSVRTVTTKVTIFDGATVIIGGLTREEVKTVNDKIPVLGNIPLIGRLFQSSAESYQKRNLLIFVTANVVSPGGSPVKENIQNISDQSIFKDPVILTPTGTIRRTLKDLGDVDR
jgi:general secretion pathway protein D